MPKIALNDLGRHCAPQRDALLAACERVIDRGWFVLGPELAALEQEVAEYCGAAHAVGVANGTDAIELALRALGVEAGDEVILSANAGMYSTTALRAIGAEPVYVDVDGHLNIDASSAAAAVTPRTRGIIATHLYGRMADVRALRAVADHAGISLVEDCAQAIGAELGGRRAGAWGDAASFSFYPTKNLGALGDAGMVTCRDAAVADRLRRLRQYGWASKYVAVDGPARNSRLDEIQAAMLRVQLPLLDGWIARRRDIAKRYAVTSNPLIQHPDVEGGDYVAHLYVIRVVQRDALRTHLTNLEISTDIHYPLLDSQQPVMQRHAKVQLQNSLQATDQILSLPCYPELTDDEINRVCDALQMWEPQ